MSIGFVWKDVTSGQVKWWTGAQRTVRMRGFYIGQLFIGFAWSVPELKIKLIDKSEYPGVLKHMKHEYD